MKDLFDDWDDDTEQPSAKKDADDSMRDDAGLDSFDDLFPGEGEEVDTRDTRADLEAAVTEAPVEPAPPKADAPSEAVPETEPAPQKLAPEGSNNGLSVSESAGPPSIVVTDLKRTFGSFTAVKGISFEVRKGGFFGFLGTNGAGKSTTIKMLSGMLKPTSGSAMLGGFDVVRNPTAVKRIIGVVPEESTLFEWLSGYEYLTFVGQVHGLDSDTITKRAKELFHLLDMEQKGNVLVHQYSKGMKKKLALAAALLYNPQILFLDEPFEGVDVVTTQILRRLLQNLTERGVTIFLTSHIIEVVQRLCREFAIINDGQIISMGRLSDGKVVGDAEGRTLEQVFLSLVSNAESRERALSWLDDFQHGDS